MSEQHYDTGNAAAGDSLIAVLDELIEIVGSARGVPMSASAMINRSEVIDLLGTARDIVPDQIEAADAIIAEASEVKADAQRRAKTILERAHVDAEETIKQAHEKAANLVSEHEITRGAESRAGEILADAQATATRMNAGADRYSDDSLAFLQGELETMLAKVHAGRQELSRREEARQEKEQQAGIVPSVEESADQEGEPAEESSEPIVQPYDNVASEDDLDLPDDDVFEEPVENQR